MPGGQYTNLQFQARQLGLADRWPAIKRAYAAANHLLGDIIKVTPSSKVVGDLAQFMVQNDLAEDDVRGRAETLSVPSSVVEFLQGALGVPHGGFPEPLRTQILHGRPPIEGRPGASMPPLDFEALRRELRDRHGPHVREVDLLSSAMYPKVFDEFMAFRDVHSDVSVLPTRQFLGPLEPGEEFTIEIERGKALIVKLMTIGELREDGTREVYFELNGRARSIRVADEKAGKTVVVRERAQAGDPGSIGAPMPGAVVEVRTKPGAAVEVGTPLVVLSAMKMETVVASPVAGVIERIAVAVGDAMAAGELLCQIRVAATQASA